jgi:Peptidase family M28/PA domain
MRKVLLVICSCLAIKMQAQNTPNPQPYASSITAEDLKKHLYIVASKEMEGRETGTEGQRKAAAYLEAQFKALGLQPGNNGSYQSQFPVYQDSMTSSQLTINGKSYQVDQDYSANVNGNHPFTLNASGIVFAGNGIVDSTRNPYKGGLNVLGKIVLIVPATGGGQGGLAENAQRNGAAAVLIAQTNFPRRPANKGQQTLNLFRSANNVNTFFISEKLAETIMGADWANAKKADAQPKAYDMEVTLSYNETSVKFESSNVIGVMEGTDKKDEYVFITAHYDHLGKRDTVIYYGADDDGSGTVALLELAEAFGKAKAAKKGPRRTLVFMAVSGEEKGLWGSFYYSNNPIFPLEKTTVDLNIDMIGRIDPSRKVGDSMNYVYVVGDDKLSTDLRPISEAVNKKYTKLELDYKFNDPNDRQRIYFRSDHYNFARKGVPIIFYFNGTHADYHRPTDTPDKINYNLYAKRTQFIFYTAWEMANRNDMLKRDLKLEVPQRGF